MMEGSSGFFEMETDYASQPKHFSVAIASIPDDSGLDTTLASRKVDNERLSRHSCRYSVTSEQQPLKRSDVFQLCLNLVKKIQNINCEDKFYCLSIPSQETSDQNNSNDTNKLKFEAATMNICPLDFSRVLLKMSKSNNRDHKDDATVHFTMLMPNTNFKIRAIPQMKLVSTPLSRLLLGKSSSATSASASSVPGNGHQMGH